MNLTPGDVVQISPDYEGDSSNCFGIISRLEPMGSSGVVDIHIWISEPEEQERHVVIPEKFLALIGKARWVWFDTQLEESNQSR